MNLAHVIESEIEANDAAFQKALPSLLSRHAGKYALMRDEEIVRVFDSIRDALLEACKIFEDDRFSIQKITDQPVDLGFFSYANNKGQT